jgi:chromosome segregation ATPase
MPKGSAKSTAAIQRLLEERRQYEAWLARITAAEDSAPEHVRTRVRADYEARLKAVIEELKAHADAARQMIAQRKETLLELQKKEKAAAEKLAETELRHEVGEYDEGQWRQVHKDALAELGAVRDELLEVERDITRLEELDTMVKSKPSEKRRATPTDELAFLKSVTEDAKNAPSPRRASGAQFQPVEPDNATPVAPADENAEVAKTLKCRECGTMNLATEWYCENCGAELAAL